MKLRMTRGYGHIGLVALLGGVVLLGLGGCPVDQNALTTDVVQAALESITKSLVDALSAYLAGS